MTYVVSNITLSCATERFDSKCLAFFHLCLVTALDDGHGLAAMNGVVANGMTVKVPYALDGQHLSLDLHLVTLHDFLDGSADIAHANIDTGLLDTSIGSGLAGVDQVVVYRVKGQSEGAVDNATVDVYTKIDLITSS